MARLSADLTLIAATILIALGAAGPVPAQQSSDTEDRLRACAEIGNPDDRVACFDSVVASMTPAGVPVVDHGAEAAAAGVAAATSAVTAASSAPAPATPATTMAPSAAPAMAAEARPAAASASVPAPKPEAIASPGPKAATAAPADRAPPAAAAAAATKVEDRGDGTGSAVITGVRENLDGRFTVELDNGQVWRETEGSRVGMPAEGAGVTISRGVFGSYRMKIDGIPREARVRQVN